MATPRPRASPESVLRGHQAQVHAAAFVYRSQRLASGDAEGYVVLWDLTIMRPRAVWRAHTNAILGIAPWGPDRIITHGRDHRLIVWRITADDEVRLSTTLPLDTEPGPRPQPWVLHILEVNTMNFCSFGSCPACPGGPVDELLVAVPNTLASESVDIYKLPSQERLYTIHSPEKGKNGMVMALALFYLGDSLTLITAYENGLAVVLQQDHQGSWDLLYRAQSHSQPVLSLDVAPSREYFLTSSADALLVKHPIPKLEDAAAVSARSGTPFAEAAHETTGADIPEPAPGKGKSLLSAALAAAGPQPAGAGKVPPMKRVVEVQTQPLKILNTKHSGQQSLRIRSDGRIFATAGWDSKVRVYAAKTMRELAVLKWHTVGCYAVAFADLSPSGGVQKAREDHSSTKEEGAAPSASTSMQQQEEEEEEREEEEGVFGDPHQNTVIRAATADVVPAARTGDLTVKERRIKHAKEAHWLAAGSKDGKVSLWDIY